MPLSDGISHVATVTDDLDRMVGFYQRVFDAELFGAVMEEEGLRHALICLNESVMLHPFEVPWVEGDDRREMFTRGRVDHFGVTVATVEALLEVRRRLQAEGEGVTDGEIRDFGAVYSLHYVDPDGVNLEVNMWKPNAAEHDMLQREDWTVVDLTPTA
jgi:catechol 2,3-dioxygenase-like lactoylglutathione lyase family enzyme